MEPRRHEGTDSLNPDVLASELHVGTEREAPQPPRAQVSTGAQKPGPTSAQRVKKSGNSARETAVLAHLQCASSAKQRWRHSGVSELILSSLPLLQHSCLAGSDASCSLAPAASTPNTSPVNVGYHQGVTAHPSPVLFHYQREISKHQRLLPATF